MILIIGRFQVQADQLAAFQKFARTLVEDEQNTDGIVGFDILQDVARPDQFVILEQWRDRVAFSRHLRSEAYHRTDAALNEFLSTDADWEEYEI